LRPEVDDLWRLGISAAGGVCRANMDEERLLILRPGWVGAEPRERVKPD